MLKKLMKYELMATGRVFAPLYAALLLVSGVSWLLMKLGMATPGTVSITVSVLLIVSIFVITLILTIQRFRQNLLSNEGHLMMTLPLKTDSLILSKLFVTSIWVLCSSIAVAFAILLLAGNEITLQNIQIAIGAISVRASANAPQMALYVFEAVLFVIVSIAFSALILYACMSLSMLVNKNRGLFTFAAFVVFSTAMQSLSALFVAILNRFNIIASFEASLISQNPFWRSQVMFILSLAAELVGCAVFYLITRYMLKNRLNLQ